MSVPLLSSALRRPTGTEEVGLPEDCGRVWRVTRPGNEGGPGVDPGDRTTKRAVRVSRRSPGGSRSTPGRSVREHSRMNKVHQV